MRTERKTRCQHGHIYSAAVPAWNSCEFDWDELKLNISGQVCRFQLAVFTAYYGNHRYAVLLQDTFGFMESHVSFFEPIGSVYHQMVYDNMRDAIAKYN